MTAWVRTSSPAAQFRLNSDLLTSWELWAAALLWPASASCTIRIISARRLFPLLQFFLQKHPLGRSRLPFLTAIIIFNSTFWPVFLFTRLSGWKTWPKVWGQQLVDSSGFNLSKDFVTCSRDLFPFSQQSVSEVQHWGSVSRSGSSFSSSELVNETTTGWRRYKCLIHLRKENVNTGASLTVSFSSEIFSLLCFWTIF